MLRRVIFNIGAEFHNILCRKKNVNRIFKFFKSRLVTILILFSVLFLIVQLVHNRSDSNKWPRNGAKPLPGISLCSEEATRFGMNQKVVTFSFFVTDGSSRELILARYLSPLQKNLEKIRKLYPGWVLRLYTNVDISEYDHLENLQDEEGVFICNVNFIPGLGEVNELQGMVWRFLPILDPTVDIFIVRDLDSVVSKRESSAVKQWEQSDDKIFHAMRDHPYQTYHILGGMWGTKNYLMSAELKENLTSIFTMKTTKDMTDQDILKTVLYDPFKHLMMIHDSYHCKKFKDSIPFPEKRIGRVRFVGEVVYNNWTASLPPCPKPCRPNYGKYWLYC